MEQQIASSVFLRRNVNLTLGVKAEADENKTKRNSDLIHGTKYALYLLEEEFKFNPHCKGYLPMFVKIRRRNSDYELEAPFS